MLAVHWSPVSNTKVILKNGIRPSDIGVFCFPLTGNMQLDRWWITAFNKWKWRKYRKKYNGFIFRITQADMPAHFGHWVGSQGDKSKLSITDLKELEKGFRETIIWRIGEQIASKTDTIPWWKTDQYSQLAEEAIRQDKKVLTENMNDYGLMRYTFEDHEIILSHAISSDRIIKVISAEGDTGRAQRRKKKYGPPKHRKAIFSTED